ncbi:dihydrofolate reductase family protein [Gordonia humi]|uniref:Dihydrofolate reductase n=1 Tax=Gordonia humi TaxID=686429 RepID=A0A840F655_9ACTN|nr:dihydrofolate reductase family protein [Gordonia humi]MBB4137376.1 dihydrofolate reductase [Gordonia humi]
MGTLSYVATMSLDGCITDADGDFGWTAPSPEMFDVHVERMREVSTEVLGRKTYDLIRYWTHLPADQPAAHREFARLWRGLDKVVASSTMAADDLADPVDRLVADLTVADVREIVAEATGVVEIFGPTTAAAAMRADLVDRYRFFVVPVILGGRPAIPADVHVDLELVHHEVFADGVVHVEYERRRSGSGDQGVSIDIA